LCMKAAISFSPTVSATRCGMVPWGIPQHTSAYVRKRQHTSAYVSTTVYATRCGMVPWGIRQHTSAYVSMRLDNCLSDTLRHGDLGWNSCT
jgi:hypothetical protein